MKRLLVLVILSCASLAAAEAESPSEPAAIWKWANFVILAIGLGYLLGKLLPPRFSSRSTEIQKDIVEAQQRKREAEKRAAEMDARLAALGADIERFRAESAEEMRQEGDRISRDTAAQVQKVEQQAAGEIEAAGKAARRQLKEYAAELALGLAEERVRARMNDATESVLVDNFVHDLERQSAKKVSSN